MKNIITEKVVTDLWLLRHAEVMTADTGAVVHVLYAGRVSKKPGCDLQDAVVLINDRKTYGDIEIHVTSDLWNSHGHHLDPGSNNVILHVAMWDKGHLPVRRQNGEMVPTIILDKFSGERTNKASQSRQPRKFACNQTNARDGNERIYAILRHAGVERFHHKCQKFFDELIKDDPAQVLYKNILRAMGYSRNTDAFERLAEVLPLKFITDDLMEDDYTLRACLFGAAGLLPSQKHDYIAPLQDEEAALLEREWRQRCSTLQGLQRQQWCFNYIYPENYPPRRLVAIGCLLTRYRHIGLLAGLQELVEKASHSNGNASRLLEDGLIINYESYWSYHLDFGTGRQKGSALLGRSKASEIVTNVILPYFAAQAKRNRDHETFSRIMDIYDGYHALPENELTAYMKKHLLLQEAAGLKACHQQGLLHIYHSYCRYKECQVCPLFRCRRQGWG